MSPLDEHDMKIAHDLGTLEGQVAAIYEATKMLPKLTQKVERHDVQLNLITWIGGTTITTIFAAIGTWFKIHFFGAQGR